MSQIEANNKEVLNTDYISLVNKEVDLIQDVIKRMANISLGIKGWTVTLITAILILKPKEVELKSIYSAVLVVIIIFWALDSFYLKSERLYRALYKKRVAARFENKQINLTEMYDLNTDKLKKWYDWPKAIFSKTMIPFYGVLFILCAFLIYNLK